MVLAGVAEFHFISAQNMRWTKRQGNVAIVTLYMDLPLARFLIEVLRSLRSFTTPAFDFVSFVHLALPTFPLEEITTHSFLNALLKFLKLP